MQILRYISNALALTILALASVSVSSAQLDRTWVASNGLDSNTCSRSSPCLTFSGALAKTNAAGEINCVDAGDFGTLTISKSITIDCGGNLGSILVTSGAGITVNAASSDVVTLRNLTITGAAGAAEGIQLFGANSLHVENVRISSFSNTCLSMATSVSNALLTVENVTMSDCTYGAFISGSTGGNTVVANISNSRILNTTTGVDADNGSRVTLRDSTVYFNNVGVDQIAQNLSNGGSVATVINSTLGYSNIAALRSHSGEFILAYGNNFINDVVVFSPNGGTIFTGADNNNAGSAVGNANGGSVPKF